MMTFLRPLLIIFLSLIAVPAMAQDVVKTIEQLQSMAQSGDAKAAYQLGQRYQNPISASEKADIQQAIAWYKVAAQQQHAKAILALAELYATGQTGEDEQAAKDYYEFALRTLNAQAAAGDGAAAMALGAMHYKGNGVKKDSQKGLEWFRRAVELGDPQAKYSIGRMALWGTTTGYTAADGLRLLQEAADAGVADSWMFIGLAHSGAYGGPVDQAKAFEAFERGAILGVPEAQRQLGVAYMTGIGAKQDVSKGFSYLKLAAENGSPEAMYQTALAYQQGVGTAANNASYQAWLRRAAGMEQRDALYRLGMQMKGSAEGMRMLRRAAELKQIDAIVYVKALFGPAPSAQPNPQEERRGN
jgi:uncharacterized protein